MSVAVVGLLVTVGVLVLTRAPVRLAAPRSVPVALGSWVGTLASSMLAALAVAVLVGGAQGVLLGVSTGVTTSAAVVWLTRREAQPRVVPVTEQEAALAADLLAAAVEAGVPLPVAVREVSAALTSPVGRALAHAHRLLLVGASAHSAVAGLLEQEATARLGRALRQALESGSPPGPVLVAAADLQRERQRSTWLQRARGAGSRAALPVGLCFLPAFLLVAVVPLVVGGLDGLLVW